MSEEQLTAIPLMREEFITKINDNLLNDRELSGKIAIGCQ